MSDASIGRCARLDLKGRTVRIQPFAVAYFEDIMTGHPSQPRKPPEWPNGSAPYASLRGGEAGHADVKSTAANDFEAEAAKLAKLRDALWAAFEAGPAAGLPNTLIDLTMAYTGALRLQLNLRSVSTRQFTPQHRPVPGQRGDAASKI